MNIAVFSASDPKAPSAIAFGNLVDLARLQVGTPSVEICDVCNTINKGSAHHCKCCSHKLQAFYAAPKESIKRLRLHGIAFPRRLVAMPERAFLIDFAAFSVVINLLVVITAYIPFR